MSEGLPEGLDPDVHERLITVEAVTENVEKMKHRADAGPFTFFSDEPPDVGGDDHYPPPLYYLAAAVGL